MDKRVFWDDNHAELGWWILTINNNSITLYDCKKYGKPNMTCAFCYSGITPKGSYAKDVALKADCIDDAKKELLGIYLEQIESQTRCYRKTIENNELAADEICILLDGDAKEKTQKECPKCGASLFNATAHIVQSWLIDGNGNFVRTTTECDGVTHAPDDDDIWECAKCGYEAAGKNFNIKK